ncbi:MAG: GFA family protein [Gammaproteobacteria bacterium]|nr:GFA family protein [Gammaproteobacteria bacterium]
MKTQTRIATCSCQSLRVECTGEPASVSLCNCQDCQRRTGSAFGIAAFYNQDNVHVDGTTSCFSRTSESGYNFSFYFCPNCGGTVYWETTRKQGFIAVAAGAFADPKFPAPTQSVFEEHQHPWLNLSL